MFVNAEGENPRIVLQFPPDFPEAFQRVIFYHELGHCLQMEEGATFTDLIQAEQDADVRGANFDCADGGNGVADTKTYFEYLKDKYGYEGDEDHGTVEEREAVVAANACHK